MTSTERSTKTFPRQPAWNSYAGVGAAAGIVSSFLIPPHVGVLSAFADPHYFGIAHVLMYGLLGALAGFVIGLSIERSRLAN